MAECGGRRCCDLAGAAVYLLSGIDWRNCGKHGVQHGLVSIVRLKIQGNSDRMASCCRSLSIFQKILRAPIWRCFPNVRCCRLNGMSLSPRDRAVAQAAKAQALLSDSEVLIASLELAIEKLKRELRGQRSERAARLIDQLELQLEELVMAATEDEVAAQAAARTSNGRSVRRRPVRKPWPRISSANAW